MATVAQHIADLADVIDLVGTLKDDFDTTYSGILTSQWGSPTADTQGILAALGKHVKDGTRRHFANLAAQIREGADAVIRDIARTLDRSDLSPNDSIARILGIGLRDFMKDNSTVFKSRGLTHNAASAVTGTGDGTLVMYTDDDQSTADDLEACTSGTITFTCTADESFGKSAGQETFSTRDALPPNDILELGGSTKVTMSVWSSQRVTAVGNAAFSEDFGATAAATDKVPSWTLDDATYAPADVTVDTTNLYRATQTISIATGAIISQVFRGLPNNRPTFFGFKYNRAIGTAAGTIDMDVGAVSMSQITLAAEAGWTQASHIAWPRNYSGGGNDIVITPIISSGTLRIAQVIIAPMTRIGGRWFIIIAGATDFIVDDLFTQLSTVAPSDLSIKDWLHRWYGLGFELPHAGSATAGWEDPT